MECSQDPDKKTSKYLMTVYGEALRNYDHPKDLNLTPLSEGKMTASENTHGHLFMKMPFDTDHNFRIGKERDLIFVLNFILPPNPEILVKKTLMYKTLYQFIVKDSPPSRCMGKDCITRTDEVNFVIL